MKVLKLGCGGLAVVVLGAALYVWVNLYSIQNAIAVQGFAGLEVRATLAGGSVYMLEALGDDGRRRSAASAASVGPDGVLLVDTLHLGTVPRVLRTLKDLGSRDVRFVFNTHAHPDHVGGVEIFRRGAQVIAHANVERRLSTHQPGVFLRRYPPQPGKLPDRTFTESFSVTFNGEEVRALHYPSAHTDGDAVVYFAGSKVLVAGDLFNGPGFLSTPSTLQGGDPQGLGAALEDLLGWLPRDVKIVPGHGRTGHLASYQELESYHRLLLDAISFLERQVSAGKSRKEILREEPPESLRSWTDDEESTRRWLGALHHHLAG